MSHATSGAKKLGSIRFDVVEVTPELAQKWLDETNTRNRKPRQFKVDTYAGDMKEGKWRENREPIEFTVDNVLINGQHRLLAIVKAGVTLPMPIKRDTPAEDMAIIDTGLSRKAADLLSMDGYKNASALAAAAKILYLWRTVPSTTMLRANSHRVTNEIIERVVGEEPELVASVDFAKSHNGFKLIPPSAVAAMHYELIQVQGKEEADTFFTNLIEGYNLEPGSPILALRNVLLNQLTQMSKPPTELRIAWTIHAMNKWLAGETDTKLIKHSKLMDFPRISVG